MYNGQLQHVNQGLRNNSNNISPINSASAASLAQTEVDHSYPNTTSTTANVQSYNNMNYETTPTPSFKPQPAILNNSNNNRKDHLYYQQDNNTSTSGNDSATWALSTNVSTPSTSDSFHNNTNTIPPTTAIDDEMQQRHMQQLFDKKRRRRESHNAVERRRRDNINERIFELSTLLPERDANKNNKGTILRKSVDHIRLLHEKVNQYQKRVQELENMLDMYRIRWGDLNGNNSSNNQPLDISGIQPHLHHHYGRDTT